MNHNIYQQQKRTKQKKRKKEQELKNFKALSKNSSDLTALFKKV